jgi:hypothetical protein
MIYKLTAQNQEKSEPMKDFLACYTTSLVEQRKSANKQELTNII